MRTNSVFLVCLICLTGVVEARSATSTITKKSSISPMDKPTDNMEDRSFQDDSQKIPKGRKAKLSGGNTAVIRQNGSGNSSSIVQKGDDNFASQTQEGSDNLLRVEQTGEHNRSHEQQLGRHNRKIIIQNGRETVIEEENP